MSLSRLPLLPVPLLHPSFLFSLPSLPLHLYMQSALIYFLQPRIFLCVLPCLCVIFYCFPPSVTMYQLLAQHKLVICIQPCFFNVVVRRSSFGGRWSQVVSADAKPLSQLYSVVSTLGPPWGFNSLLPVIRSFVQILGKLFSVLQNCSDSLRQSKTT
ncbi:unnamed protein product, partial [Ixodes pacificus]